MSALVSGERFSTLSPRVYYVAGKNLATCLLRMPAHLEADCPESAREELTTMQVIVDKVCEQFERQSIQFALAAGRSAAVSICNFRHPTAHHAVFEQTTIFLSSLWQRLDPIGWADTISSLPLQSPETEFWRDDSSATAQWRVEHGSCWDAKLVVDHWSIAKPTIRKLLNSDRRKRIKSIASRLAGECDKMESEGRSKIPSTASGGDKVSSEAPSRPPLFVPNEFQKAILIALNGKALTKQKLAVEVCSGEGTRLYRVGGIKELKEHGLVMHKHRLGYYRPDRPPPPV